MTFARPLVPLLAALLLVAGCGEDKQASISLDGAAATTRDAATSRVHMVVEASGSGLPRKVEVTASGVTSLTEPRMDLTFDSGALLGNVKARVVATGEDVFVDPPALPGVEVPGGRRWITADLSALADALGLDASALSELFRVSPAQQMQAIEALERKGDVKRVDDEEIDGVTTGHFRGDLRTTDLLSGLPAARRKRLEKALRELDRLPGGSAGDFDAPAPTDIWVDEQGRVRRIATKLRTPARDGLPAGRFALRFDYSDFGTPVDAAAPPAAEVFDATGLIKRELLTR